MNLDFAKVCGKHSAIYEAYYKQIDPKGSGAIEAMTAAKFLKKSGLSDVVLSRIWDLSDPNGKGFLDKPGFFVALKLVSLAQAGQVINMTNIYSETPNPPKVGDLPKIMPPRIQTVPLTSGGVTSGDWSISVIDRLKYEQLFESLKPVGGMLPGNKVKGVLMESKLPMDTLGKIWDLADQDKDGNLDKHEFLVAMHLVYQTLEKRTVPDILPPELRKAGPPPKPAPPVMPAAAVPRAPSGEGFGDGGFVANFPKDIAPPPAIPAMPPMGARIPPVGAVASQPIISTDPLIPIAGPPSGTATADWVVSAPELKRFEVMFRDSDRDKDGLVSGLEVKNIFLQSGVHQNCLAHIWALCDTNQSGKLALEQFALAMWMVERKQKGIEPPQVLTANMVPPSMRAIVSGVDLQAQVESKPTYSNPELEMISKEIEELAKERRALETEIAQKEADIRIKSGEVRSLQSELDTLSATLRQLENQRGEAQKRLDDLKAQVNKIREQSQKQEETINEQEGELNAKRSELQKLKDEEAALQKEYDENNKELQKLTRHLQNTQLQISSVRSMVTQLLETQRQMTDALLMCRAAIESQDGELVTEYQLKIEPDFDDARKILEKKIDEPKDDPFADSKSTNGFSNGNADPFTSNVAANNTITTRSGFDDSFNMSSGFDSGFDAFGGSSAFGQQKDPFGNDAFSSANKMNAVTPEPGKDDFGSDPFAALHAPTGQGQVLSPNTQKSGPPRPESPSPALPPKKSKVPPPRPAPPRPLQGPARPTSGVDAFGGTAMGGGGFADFADFDNKVPDIPPPLPIPRITALTVTQNTADSNKNSSLFDNITELSTTVNNTIISSESLFSNTASQFTAFESNSISKINTNSIKNNENNFARSNTPLQQAATSTAVITGPTDFSDDPFKDYRYEDPFSIKDPFDDDEDTNDIDPNKVFKDVLSSDDDLNINKTKDSIKDIATDSSSQTYNSAKSHTPISNEFLDKFDDFNMNPSPVPSQQSSTSQGASCTASSSKSQSITPIPANVKPFSDFADFDAFSNKSTTSTNESLNAINSTIKNSSNNINIKDNSPIKKTNNNETDNNDSFFDAFNDNFGTNSSINHLKTLDNSKTTNIFDAFGGGTSTAFDEFTTKSSKLFDDDDFSSTNSFGQDFFKNSNVSSDTKDKNLNINSNNLSKNISNNDNNFTAAFTAFGEEDCSSDFKADFSTALNNSKNLNSKTAATTAASSTNKLTAKVQNQTTLSKTPNINTGAYQDTASANIKLPDKYASDYSKTDNFDADLEEAIKRSMIDQ